jgi:uncharacterized protein YbjT (DUF2867 family)
VIAVVGATGQVGSALVGHLATAGEAVRALTRRPGRWVGPAGAGGEAVEAVEVVAADADAPGGLAGAFDGARAAFLMSDQRIVPGSRPTRVERLVEAAVAAGVEHLVLLSVLSGSSGADVVGAWNAATEACVTGAGVGWTLLRPGRFFANAAHWARFVRTGEPVSLGFARRVAAGIDPDDVAAVAAVALTEDRSACPAGWSSIGAAVRLTGPEPLTPLDELAILREVLGRPLRARELTPDETRRGMIAAGEVPEVVDAIVARSLAGEEGTQPSPDLAGLLGRPARRFEDWAREHAGLFGAASPDPGVLRPRTRSRNSGRPGIVGDNTVTSG